MPKVLKNIIIGARVYKTDETVNVPEDISAAEAQSLIDSGYLDAEKESTNPSTASPSPANSPAVVKLTVKEAIVKISLCETIAEVQELTEDETRKKVIDAAEEKIIELEKQLEREATGGITVEEIITNINKQELESEVAAICADIDGDILTENEKAQIEEAAENRINEIRKPKKK